MLAALNPLGVVAAAVFVAGMLVGADSMSRAVGVPTYIADVIVAVSLLSMLVATMLARYQVRWSMSRDARHRRSPAPFWVAVLRIATPLIFGTLGVLLCERAGVLNLGIEGIMVAGAFTGWLAVYHGAGLWTGVLVAALTGAAFGLLHALLTVPLGAVAARLGPRHHAVRDQPGVLRLPRELPARSTAPPTIQPFADDGAGCRMPVLDAQTPLTLLALSARAGDRARCSYRTPAGPGGAHGRRESRPRPKGQGISVTARAHRRDRRRLAR